MFGKACFKRRATAVLCWLVSVVSNLTQSDKIAVAKKTRNICKKKRFGELLKCILMYL